MIEMNWEELAEISSVALLAATKFLFSPSAAYYLDFSVWKSFIVTTAGGLGGIITFSFLGEVIRRYWRYFTMLFAAPFSRHSYKELVNRPPKRFSPVQRIITKIKRKFGLAGIAFVTPAIISIPVGCVVAMNLYRPRGKVLAALIISLLFWSVLLNLITPPVIRFFVGMAATV